MSELDRLARSVEQSEAGIEALGKLLSIMWHNLAMPDEMRIRVIEKWIETTMKPPTNTG